MGDVGAATANLSRENSLPRWAYGLTIALILAVHTVGRFGCYCTDVRSDSYTYAAFALRMVHGEVFYEDFSLDKPPGLMVLNMLPYLVLPASRASLIPLETIGLLLGYWLFFRLARLLYDRTTALILAVAACIAVNYFAVMDFTGEGFGLAETYMFGLHLAAVLCYIRAGRSDRWWWLPACGACVGLSLTIKQTAAPLGAALGLHWIVVSLVRDRDHQRAMGGAGRLILGLAIGLAPMVVMILAQGTWWRASREILFSSARWLRRDTAWPSAWSHVTPLWAPMIWIALAAYLHAASAVFSKRRSGSPGLSRIRVVDASFFALWLALECAMLVYLPRRSFHYYILSMMPLLLLSGEFWRALQGLLAGQTIAARSVFIVAAVLWSAATLRPALSEFSPVSSVRYRGFSAAEDQQHFEEVVRWENGSRGIHDGSWPGGEP